MNISPTHAALAAIGLFTAGLISRTCSRVPQPRKDKALRSRLSEKQIDKMVMDSFPASDPPSTY